VKYRIGILKGKAIVKGIAVNSVAILGKTYILEDLSGNFPNAGYPYKHFCCLEIDLED